MCAATSKKVIRADFQEQADPVHDECGHIRQKEESGGFEEHPFPGVQLFADDCERGQARDRQQAEEHHAETLQRGVGNVPLLGQIPIVQSICEGGDNGLPVALNPDTMTGLAFRELAQAVAIATDARNHQQPPTKAVNTSK